MKLAKGCYLPLSLPRRMVSDMLFAGQQLTLIPGERTMPLAEVVAARQTAWPKPSWLSLFIKAYATVAARRPELRRVYLTWPWPRLFEYDETVVAITVEREWRGERGLFLARILSPEKKSLLEIDNALRIFKERPVDSISAFRGALRLASLPTFLRRWFWRLTMNGLPRLRAQFLGTLGGSVTAGMGATALSLITPWTLTFFYDAVKDDGSQIVRFMFDHRVCDGRVICSALKEVERELRGPIRDELLALGKRALAKAA
jgi:hypothetical protein